MAAFDQSQRPVRTVDFDFEQLDGGDELDQRLEDRLAVLEWFYERLAWILSARTVQSRKIRAAVVQAEIDRTSLAAIAKRFGVTRQAVYDQAKTAPKLVTIFHRRNELKNASETLHRSYL
jgi:hypothetical protein